jgi:3-oxoacyl-[acyl-carrier protein] reductase
MADLKHLKDRWALVTGGSRGIGLASAEALADAGCNVVVTARDPAASRTAGEGISRRFQVAACGVPCDVTRATQVRALFEELGRISGGRLDVLVCNAGYPFLREIWDARLHAAFPEALGEWCRTVFETDALGSLYCTREALPRMMAQGTGGSIVYIASTPAIEGFQGTAYTMAKSAVLGLMKDVAAGYGSYSIRANALALGNIATPATLDQTDPAIRDSLVKSAPLRRWGTPAEVAQAVLFLASDRSSYMTGQTLVVDGGMVRR